MWYYNKDEPEIPCYPSDRPAVFSTNKGLKPDQQTQINTQPDLSFHYQRVLPAAQHTQHLLLVQDVAGCSELTLLESACRHPSITTNDTINRCKTDLCHRQHRTVLTCTHVQYMYSIQCCIHYVTTRWYICGLKKITKAKWNKWCKYGSWSSLYPRKKDATDSSNIRTEICMNNALFSMWHVCCRTAISHWLSHVWRLWITESLHHSITSTHSSQWIWQHEDTSTDHTFIDINQNNSLIKQSRYYSHSILLLTHFKQEAQLSHTDSLTHAVNDYSRCWHICSSHIKLSFQVISLLWHKALVWRIDEQRGRQTDR